MLYIKTSIFNDIIAILIKNGDIFLRKNGRYLTQNRQYGHSIMYMILIISQGEDSANFNHIRKSIKSQLRYNYFWSNSKFFNGLGGKQMCYKMWWGVTLPSLRNSNLFCIYFKLFPSKVKKEKAKSERYFITKFLLN